jgi:regulator of ribosome biosynthesis
MYTESAREQLLLSHARDNTQLLINRIFDLPTSRDEKIGAIAQLPPPTTVIPREKHVPKPKPLTKWERYAKLKGIEKQKRGRMVWDDEMREWRPRYGYKRANDELRDWLIPAKDTDSMFLFAPTPCISVLIFSKTTYHQYSIWS